MGDEDAAQRRAAAAGLDDPAFRSAFAAAYGGMPKAAEAALERFVTDGADDGDDRAAQAALYGRGADEAARRRAADALGRARAERQRVRTAVEAALAASPPQPVAADGVAPEPVPLPATDVVEEPPAPRERRRIPLVAAIAAAVVLLPVAYLAGAGTRGTAAPAPTPSPTELPAALVLNDLAEQDRVTYASPGDPRAASFTAGPILGGYSVRAACLAMQRRPRTVPSATVQLLDPTGRLIAAWAMRCDGEEHRFPALPPAEFTRHVQIVLDFDDSRVRAASAALLPNLT